MDIPTFILAISVVGIFSAVIYYLSLLVRENKLTALINRVSANINKIYCIHWILLMYGAVIRGVISDAQADKAYVIYLVGVLAFVVSAVLSALFQRNKKNLDSTYTKRTLNFPSY